MLNGEKIWISNAGYAGLFTVFAKVPVEVDGKTKQRVTAFIVDAHAPGVSLGKIEEKMGIKASDTRTVSFENVKVPVEDRLGDVGQGFKIALEILNSGRLGLAAASSRGARSASSTMALAYAKQREQFGRPIGSFEMIQRKFAMAAADCYAADAAWMLTARMVDRGGIDFSLETAACKIFASELAFRAANDAMQIAGGIGYSKEYPYEQAVRDSRINLIFEGTNEILRALIALSALQQPGEHLKALGKAFKDPLHSIGAIGSLHRRAREAAAREARVHARCIRRSRRRPSWWRRSIHDLALARREAAHRARQGDHRAAVPPGADGERGDRHLPRRRRRCRARPGRSRRRAAPEKAAADLDNARIFIPAAMRRARRSVRALERNQDARLKALAERALESGTLTVLTPTDA